MQINWRILTAALVTIGVMWLFGPGSATLGYGAYALVKHVLSKSHPDDNVPVVAGVVVGLLVATFVAFCVGYMQSV